MPILKTCLLEYMEDTLRKVEVKINSARKYLGNMHTKYTINGCPWTKS